MAENDPWKRALNGGMSPPKRGAWPFLSSPAVETAKAWAFDPPMVEEQRGMLWPGLIPRHVAGTQPKPEFAWPGLLHEPWQRFQELTRTIAGTPPQDRYGRAFADRVAGPAFDVAGAAATGGIAMPKPAGSLGTFGGRIGAQRLAAQGEHAPLQAIELAERMKAAGAGRDEIYRTTSRELEGTHYAGVHHGADGLPRFEIDDSAMRVRPSADWAPMTEHFPHPDLERVYPSFRDAESMVAIVPGSNARGSWFSREAPMMTVQAPDIATAKSVALHEGQHHVQDIEGFASGASPEAMREHPLYPKLIKEFSSEAGRLGLSPEAQEKLAQFTLYKHLPGEVEARQVQQRMSLTPEQRRARVPWLDLDVGEDRIIPPLPRR